MLALTLPWLLTVTLDWGQATGLNPTPPGAFQRTERFETLQACITAGNAAKWQAAHTVSPIGVSTDCSDLTKAWVEPGVPASR